MKVNMSLNVVKDLECSMDIEDFASHSGGVTVKDSPESRSSLVSKFGPITITTKTEGADKFSLIWHNRMNNASIALHKFSKGSYVVELRVAGGAPDVVNFRAVEHALAFAVLNTDVRGVQDEHAITARRFFYQYICGREPRAKDSIAFTKTAWQINRLRGEEVKFTEGALSHVGRLMFLLPKERAIIYTYTDGKTERHTIPFDEIWM